MDVATIRAVEAAPAAAGCARRDSSAAIRPLRRSRQIDASDRIRDFSDQPAQCDYVNRYLQEGRMLTKRKEL